VRGDLCRAKANTPMTPRSWLLLMITALLVAPAIYAGNQVMGEIEFEGKSKVEKTSGVWVDGQYVGYLKELKGSKKVLLLPGEHTITVRQDGYRDFVSRVDIKPGEKRVVRVAMEKGPTGAMPAVTATVKIAVNPTRAAVFVDGLFVGHVAEFQGLGRGLLVAPGSHAIRIALPGYQTFETQISPGARQKVEVRTNLLKSAGNSDDPLISGKAGEKTAPAPPPDAGPPPQKP
jgi:PEGA domain